MAEGGEYKTEGLNSFMSDSDFSFDFYCELCIDDGKNVEATGFCVDCGEYLCGGCYNAHPKTRQTRLHKLLDTTTMPRDKPLSVDRISKGIATSCKIHAGRPVEFYCKTHNVLGCSLCFVTSHRNCSHIESIVEKSESILDSQEYKDFIQTIKSLNQRTQHMLERAQANMAQTKECYSEVIRSVTLFREKVIMDFDKLEQDIIAEIQTLMSEEENKMASISNTCNEVTNTLENMLTEFENLQSSRRVCQVYISMKNSSEHVKALQDNVHETGKDITAMTFKFEQNRQLENLINSPGALGVISRDDQVHTKTGSMKPVHVADIAVKSDGQRWKCCISGSAVITNNRLIIADFDNFLVKLLDTENNKVISELTVSSGPWDVTVMSRNQAAVTIRSKQKILILGVSDKLTLEREIAVNGKCFGLAYNNNRLVLTYKSPSYIEIMDLYGKVMKRVEYDSDGNELFSAPNYVCVSNDGESIYVSNCNTNNVTCLTFEGVVKSIYSDSKLESPEKVCVDHNGNVYVCGYESRNVHMLTADLTKIQIILTSADRLGSEVYSISHCQETNRLYVGMWCNNYIKVFQLP